LTFTRRHLLESSLLVIVEKENFYSARARFLSYTGSILFVSNNYLYVFMDLYEKKEYVEFNTSLQVTSYFYFLYIQSEILKTSYPNSTHNFGDRKKCFRWSGTVSRGKCFAHVVFLLGGAKKIWRLSPLFKMELYNFFT